MDNASNNYTAQSIDHRNKKADIEKLRRYSKMVNIADDIDKDKLYHIGKRIVKEAQDDDKTREEWFDKYNEALKIAKQIIDKKTYPFDNASNVKLPLILQGCIQTNARLMPEIIQNNKTVYISMIGVPTKDDEDSGERVSNHMSLQTMKQVRNWITDTDKLMMTLPLVGTVFRKWCYDPILRKPASYLCLPTEVIVSNDVSSLYDAQRITHVLRMSKNDIVEKMRYGLYSTVELFLLKDESVSTENSSDDEEKKLPSDVEDSANSYIVYEQCRYLDLDDDGYEEPYIVTVLKKDCKVLRIVAAYDEESFIFNAKDELIKIISHEYYSAHHFLPSADGTFLGMGFGSILLQLNSACNSLTNNLIDSGTLANLRAGFLSKDLRLQKGDLNFSPGEWKMVNTSLAQNIQNAIFPLPISEPSQTLFTLLEFLVNFGRQVANISDVLMGNASNAEMPATSVVTLVEQGTKIFSSILMRLYESFKQEYEILFDLNRRYISLYPETDLMTKTGFVTVEDYKSNKFNVLPVANPSMGMNTLRLSKLQMVMQMAQGNPMLDMREITERFFKAIGISDADKLFVKQAPPPSAEEVKTMAEADLTKSKAALTQTQQHEILMQHEQEAIKAELDEKRIQVDATYKGGMLALEKGKAAADIALKQKNIELLAAQIKQIESNIVNGSDEVKKASQAIDEEEKKIDIKPDFTEIEKALDLTGGNVQGNMQSQGGEPQGAPEAPQEQQGGNELPPELDSQLKQVAQDQQQEQAE